MKQHILLPLFTVFASAALATPAGPKPTITKQPVSVAKFEGGIAVFSATATNATSYQWAFNTLPFSDGNGIIGSHSSVLTINPIPTDDAGSYQLIAMNAAGAVTSSVAKLTVLLETAKPVVTIIKPAIGTRSNNITFSGTASDSVRVTGVGYVISNLNNPPYVLSGAAALSSGKGSSNWTFTPGFLSPGTNILMVTATNYPGKTNTATRAFFSRVEPSPAMPRSPETPRRPMAPIFTLAKAIP